MSFSRAVGTFVVFDSVSSYGILPEKPPSWLKDIPSLLTHIAFWNSSTLSNPKFSMFFFKILKISVVFDYGMETKNVNLDLQNLALCSK